MPDNLTPLPTLSNNKLIHSKAVAEKMRSKALELGWDITRAEDMYLLGLLHDVGYIVSKNHHANAGALLLARNNYRYSFEVQHHGRPVDNPSDELLLLWWADLTTLYNGWEATLKHRLKDVEIRYGVDSYQYQNVLEIMKILYVNRERIQVEFYE